MALIVSLSQILIQDINTFVSNISLLYDNQQTYIAPIEEKSLSMIIFPYNVDRNEIKKTQK